MFLSRVCFARCATTPLKEVGAETKTCGPIVDPRGSCDPKIYAETITRVTWSLSFATMAGYIAGLEWLGRARRGEIIGCTCRPPGRIFLPRREHSLASL